MERIWSSEKTETSEGTEGTEFSATICQDEPMPSSTLICNAIFESRRFKELAEKAVAQVPEAALFQVLDEESNSIAMILKHISGSLLSRWTDFLTSDGDKPSRDRESEFRNEPSDTKERLMERWEASWRCLFAALESLQPEDLEKIITIRGEPCSVLEAIHRQMTHSAYHVGQIVFLAKHYAGSRWQSLSIPRGKSEEFRAAPGRRGARQYWKR